ncbi:MAG: hypothetical protein U0Y82_15650 [Thermoleophilia bacterium]
MAPRVWLSLAALAMAAVPAAGQTSGSTAVPPIPATNNAKSPFLADRASSEPLGLSPNQTTTPLKYPAEPVVLSWSPVPGAVKYTVEVSTSPSFAKPVWSTTTDQWQASPTKVLPDATYWWRVTAVDAAGSKGVTSDVAKFAKTWPATVTGGVLSATPGGAATSLIRTTPYMRWDAVPGARAYDTQVAAADQFAAPQFYSYNFTNPAMTVGLAGVMPDDGYQWRVRATDPEANPGPWVNMGSFTKAWVAPQVVSPQDGDSISTFELRWDAVAGAEKYQVEVTDQQYTWEGDPLVFNVTTAATGFVPSYDEERAKALGNGRFWWRVRPVVDGQYGTWTDAQQFDWVAPSATAPSPVLSDSGDIHTALTPQLSSVAVTGATIYRFDVATDSQFNNIVESQITLQPAWVPRSPLPDNQVGQGYYWRVIPGTGATRLNPRWMIDENLAPRGSFKKQTDVALGSAASGTVAEPPLFSWSDVPGAAKYELQLARTAQFDSPGATNTDAQTVTVWGTGTSWAKDQGKRLPTGTWFWRVRAHDGADQALTWSQPQTFTLTLPALR